MRGGGVQGNLGDGPDAAAIDRPRLISKFGLAAAPGLSSGTTGFIASGAGESGQDVCVDVLGRRAG